MLTNFGKFCRKLRIDRGELLLDMANRLGVSAAFLSKVENGKKKPPKEWRDILISEYDLNETQVYELDDCIFDALNRESIDISEFASGEKDLMLSFARQFNNLSDEKIKKIRNIINN